MLYCDDFISHFEKTAKIFSVTPLTTIDFVTYLCSYIGLRQANYCRTYILEYNHRENSTQAETESRHAEGLNILNEILPVTDR